MKNPRIYLDQQLNVGEKAWLSDDAFGHVIRVLRLNQGDKITVFNGRNDAGFCGEYQASLTTVNKKKAEIAIESRHNINNVKLIKTMSFSLNTVVSVK